MDLQNLFYLTAIISFVLFAAFVIYLVNVVNKLNNTIRNFADKAKSTAETIALTKYSLKAGLLKMFLNMIGGKGGDKYE